MFPLTPELISMAGGALTGFVFKYMAQRAQEKQAQFDRMMTAIDKSDQSADKAVARVSVDAGKVIRRIIVIAILFAVIAAPFILALLGQPTVVHETVQRPEYLFGLFGGGTKMVFVELKGYLMAEEIRQALMAIIGFYFGSATAKTS